MRGHPSAHSIENIKRKSHVPLPAQWEFSESLRILAAIRHKYIQHFGVHKSSRLMLNVAFDDQTVAGAQIHCLATAVKLDAPSYDIDQLLMWMPVSLPLPSP